MFCVSLRHRARVVILPNKERKKKRSVWHVVVSIDESLALVLADALLLSLFKYPIHRYGSIHLASWCNEVRTRICIRSLASLIDFLREKTRMLAYPLWQRLTERDRNFFFRSFPPALGDWWSFSEKVSMDVEVIWSLIRSYSISDQNR